MKDKLTFVEDTYESIHMLQVPDIASITWEYDEDLSEVGIWNFTVDEQHRRKGIGRELMNRALVAIYKEKPIDVPIVLFCSSMDPFNFPDAELQKFYESFGFVFNEEDRMMYLRD